MNGTELLDLIAKHSGDFLTTVLGGGIGAYLGSYLKKKGENLATHEDVDKLVDQMTAVTEATKKIEAKIFNDMWERQRKWEVKREALFEAMKELGNVEYGLVRLILAYTTPKVEGRTGSSGDRLAALEIWNSALVNFKKARILTLLASSDELRTSFETLERSMIAMARDTTATADGEVTSPWFPTFRKQMDAVIELVRKELYMG